MGGVRKGLQNIVNPREQKWRIVEGFVAVSLSVMQNA